MINYKFLCLFYYISRILCHISEKIHNFIYTWKRIDSAGKSSFMLWIRMSHIMDSKYTFLCCIALYISVSGNVLEVLRIFSSKESYYGWKEFIYHLFGFICCSVGYQNCWQPSALECPQGTTLKYAKHPLGIRQLLAFKRKHVSHLAKK